MDKHMKASEARKLTEESLKGPAIYNYLNSIDGRIHDAAKGGKSSISNPHSGSDANRLDFFLSGDEREAVKSHYVNLGYKWKHHADPDRGHPCSSSYETLSW
jgi:hypothetical protein